MGSHFEKTVYHKNDADKIYWYIRLQQMAISYDKEDRELWLGDGIYFWEKPKDAEWWDGKYPSERIIEAKLSCPVEQYLNLDQNDEMSEFQEFCMLTKKKMEESEEYSFDFTNGHFQVNSFFFNVFKETYRILLLKYSFPTRNNRPQYCATNNDIVSDIKEAARPIANRWEWYL